MKKAPATKEEPEAQRVSLAKGVWFGIDTLSSELTVNEGAHLVRYSTRLDSDRVNAHVVREVLDDDGEPQSREEWVGTWAQLMQYEAHDCTWAKAPHVVWQARGLWGIPG